MDQYIPLILGKKLAIVANHTTVVEGVHLVDTLLLRGIPAKQITKVFVPEHGFRGNQAAGHMIDDERDPVTGIPIVSLYGKYRKPPPESLEGVELVLFDLQDVGARFYTYISTLHYVMEACGENGIPLVVLDRPNPNGGFIDGPVMEPEYTSFVGMHPIPVVYGLTIGELAQMINGEGWLKDGIKCDLTVIPCLDYYHGLAYTIPVKPSPNLTSSHSILLYPSTCFFEGTVISEGRGTHMPFEVYGHPELEGAFTFTPLSIPGMANHPKLEGRLCRGEDLRDYIPADEWTRIRLHWLLDAYAKYPDKDEFFIPYFETLAGSSDLREQIEAGWDESRIRESWKEDLDAFKLKRLPYLLYD